MWSGRFEWDCECYDFILDGRSIAYIEVGADHNQSPFFFGFVITKSHKHFHMEGGNIDSLMFKMVLKLKEFGWEIDGFPIASEN
jgi:hypothetical protein